MKKDHLAQLLLVGAACTSLLLLAACGDDGTDADASASTSDADTTETTVAVADIPEGRGVVTENPDGVLTELGFTLDDLAERDATDGIAVSFEQLEELDADLLFWQVRQADDGSPDIEGLDVLRTNPLFERLPAVAAGRYVEVPNRPWYFPTILGANRILDDVEAALLAAGS